MKPEGSPDPDLEAELRQLAGRELTEEAAEDERLTEKLRDRRTGLRQRLLEFGASSRLVRVELESRSFSGAVGFVGTDFAELERGDDRAAVRFEAGIWTASSRLEKPSTPVSANVSIKGHLAGIESDDEEVDVLDRSGTELRGVLLTVAVDHVVLRTGVADLLVPLAEIAAVIRARGS